MEPVHYPQRGMCTDRLDPHVFRSLVYYLTRILLFVLAVLASHRDLDTHFISLHIDFHGAGPSPFLTRNQPFYRSRSRTYVPKPSQPVNRYRISIS